MQCAALTAPDNSLMECSDESFYSSTCSFTCNVGFYMVGDAATLCGEDDTENDPNGAWSLSLPTCQSK